MQNQPISSINKIEFQVFTNNEIYKSSAMRVNNNVNEAGVVYPEIYDNGAVKKYGLGDLRLGSIENNIICETCFQQSLDCPGHFGHTKLAEPVFNYGYLNIIKDILNCICLRCSKLLINKNIEDLEKILQNSIGKARFSQIKKLLHGTKYCQRTDQNCGAPVPDITRQDEKKGEIALIASWKLDKIQLEEDGKTPKGIFATTTLQKTPKAITDILTPIRVSAIFKNMSDNDCRILGFDPKTSRPENLIIEYFPIPPLSIRPSYKFKTNNVEDSITSKLVDIIKSNKGLSVQLNNAINIVDKSIYNQQHLSLLQYHVASYFDNDSMKAFKSELKGSGKAFTSITKRLKGKTGRLRGNLMGKRVNFSARTVITSDPNLALDELGVPIKIAMNLTFPEVVTENNIDRLTKLVRNGSFEYPGANYIIINKGDKKSLNKELNRIDLKYFKKTIKLKPGYIVERHLVDGDPVLFNRQPTLHKMSMMCHKVKVIKNENLCTFRLNVTVTTPYNAD